MTSSRTSSTSTFGTKNYIGDSAIICFVNISECASSYFEAKYRKSSSISIEFKTSLYRSKEPNSCFLSSSSAFWDMRQPMKALTAIFLNVCVTSLGFHFNEEDEEQKTDLACALRSTPPFVLEYKI